MAAERLRIEIHQAWIDAEVTIDIRYPVALCDEQKAISLNAVAAELTIAAALQQAGTPHPSLSTTADDQSLPKD